MSAQTGFQAVTGYLEREGVSFEVVEHKRTESAAAEARAAGLPADDVAKTVVLRDDSGYRLAVIPASRRLDLCGAGDHEHGVLLDPLDLVRAGQARVADLCED
jgi:prolyl-tRNA editing enzyme YbaK/EbsC (Cys-tRNA(Pro) deacylase)